MKTESQPRTRGGLQFSIKAIMILTIVVAAYFAGRIPAQRSALEERQKAEKAIKRALVAERDARMQAEMAMQQALAAQAQAEQARLQAAIQAEKQAKRVAP